MSEKAQLKYLDGLISILRGLMISREADLNNKIQNLIRAVESKQAIDIDSELQIIFRGMDEMQAIHSAFVLQFYPQSFNDAASIVQRQLNLKPSRNLDNKTLGVLVLDSIQNFNETIGNSKSSLNRYFKVASKQTLLTESEINSLIAEGLIKERDGHRVFELIRDEFAKGADKTIFDQAKLDKYKSDLFDRFKKNINANQNLSDALKNAVLAKKTKALEEGRFIQIINKNGDVMTFSVSRYAEMVSRTKIGDAQTAGTIEMAKTFDILTFKVSSHNTESPVCQPWEGKILTIAPKNSRLGKLFPQLNDESRPTYHVNCEHRLSAHPLADFEIELFEEAQRNAA